MLAPAMNAQRGSTPAHQNRLIEINLRQASESASNPSCARFQGHADSSCLGFLQFAKRQRAAAGDPGEDRSLRNPQNS